MNTEREFICIVCPMGCRIRISIDEKEQILNTVGQSCKEGKEYVKSEYLNSARVLTTTVLVEGVARRILPVRTTKPIPKENVKKAMRVLADVRVVPPVQVGQIIVPNIMNTGIDLVATDHIL